MGGQQGTPTQTVSPPDISVTVMNNRTTASTVTVAMVPRVVETVTVRTDDGGTRTVGNFSDGARLFRPDDAREVVFPEDSEQRTSRPLQHGGTDQVEIRNPPRPATIITVATEGVRVIAWGTGDCGTTGSLATMDFELHE
jgi:hypothetical protein